jgi:DNA gyrase subunit A
MAVRFNEDDVRPMGRIARGVKGVSLRGDNDYIVGCEVVKGNESIVVVCEKGFGKRSLVEDFRQTKRGGVGVRSIITSERNGLVIGAMSVSDQDSMLMMSTGGQAVRIPIKDLRVMGRATQGVTLVNLKDYDTLMGIQKLEQSEDEDEDVIEGEVAVGVEPVLDLEPSTEQPTEQPEKE